MKKILLILTTLLLSSGFLWAHPHIISMIYPHIYFDDSGMNGFYLQWIYDPVYSSQIIYDVDTDMNLILNEEEQENARGDFFSVLKGESWFMTILVNGEKTLIPDPINFSAEIDKEDETIMFTFYIPLHLPYESNGTTVNIEFTDPSQYTAFKIPVESLQSNGTKATMDNININYAGIIEYKFSE